MYAREIIANKILAHKDNERVILATCRGHYSFVPGPFQIHRCLRSTKAETFPMKKIKNRYLLVETQRIYMTLDVSWVMKCRIPITYNIQILRAIKIKAHWPRQGFNQVTTILFVQCFFSAVKFQRRIFL